MNIILCGFQGCGKTTCGYALAQMTGLPLYDLDHLIMERYGSAHTNIRELHVFMGEEQFRFTEAEVLFSLKKEKPGVIALGGGSLTHADARAAVRELGSLAYLYVPHLTLEKQLQVRIMKQGCPSYLDPADPFGAFKWLYCHRHHLFSTLAQVTVEVAASTPHDVASEVWLEITRLPRT